MEDRYAYREIYDSSLSKGVTAVETTAVTILNSSIDSLRIVMASIALGAVILDIAEESVRPIDDRLLC